MKKVVEEVFRLNFDEIDLVVVLMSLHVGKKNLSNMPFSQ